MANKRHKTQKFLNPAEKGKKASKELKNNKKYTNSGILKKDAHGKPIKLKVKERAYRAGYLDARKDNANAYNARKKKDF